MANRLVSVDDNLNLPPAVQEQLTVNVRNEFLTYVTTAESAADSAQQDAATAAVARDQAVEAANSVTIPTAEQVEAVLTDAANADEVLTDRTVEDLSYQFAPDPRNVRGPAGTKVTVPTPDSPTGGEATHPSVVFMRDGWNGYRYWMAFTPYAGGNDDLEDPCIVASNDGVSWVVPAGLTNPIDDADGQPAYNSDTELVMGPDNKLYLFWRYYDETAATNQERLLFSTSENGVDWSAKQVFMQNTNTVRRLMSPTLVYKDSRWYMWAVDILPSPNRVVRMVSNTADPMEGWSVPVDVNVGTMQSGKEPWHIYVAEIGGRYVALLNDCTTDQSGASGDLLFLTSADGLTFTNGGGPMIPRAGGSGGATHNAVYRGCFIPAYQGGKFGLRVFYGAWTTSPIVWNLFSTWVTDQTDAYSPFTTALIAPGATQTVSVTFPPGRFTAPPTLLAGTNNSRATIAVNDVTTTGGDIIISNWTTGNINAGVPFWWHAIPRPV